MIAVIDVCGNNLTSLTNAIHRLGFNCLLTHDIEEIRNASHVILPGVGAAETAMTALYSHHLVPLLQTLSQPMLGICLGMQLLFDKSEEGNVEGLKWISGTVRKLYATENYPVPHMGWNQLIWTKDSPLSHDLDKEEHVYFVHGYALLDSPYAVAQCHYGQNFSVIVQNRNVYGMQFHPEKSAQAGLKLLNNFLQLEKAC